MSFVPQFESWLRSHADPEQAAPMAAYMRGLFPFLGIRSPERVALTRTFIAEQGLPSDDELERVVRELWLLPEREFHYSAMLLLERRMKKAAIGQIDLLEWMITTKSWWDTVDIIAGKLMGNLFARFPELIERYAMKWIYSENMWLRRSAILFQLHYKERINGELLFQFIRQCAHEEEFFIRKAIGWALREYAKTNAAAVIRFVETTELSPLSVREALKHLKR
ncbi:DNA alkylation repair protein [Paenibacillus sp. GCM10027626]|uniref:DNA alkylation repair protein n=1 Tax=Paenibacillus sp. GCM10027626 TaxID=3273411 RepID=UPI00362E7D5E